MSSGVSQFTWPMVLLVLGISRWRGELLHLVAVVFGLDVCELLDCSLCGLISLIMITPTCFPSLREQVTSKCPWCVLT